MREHATVQENSKIGKLRSVSFSLYWPNKLKNVGAS